MIFHLEPLGYVGNSQWTSITNTPLETMCLWPMFHVQREKLFSKELEITPLLFRSPRLKTCSNQLTTIYTDLSAWDAAYGTTETIIHLMS
jgi:hypothetical protein